jgi:hypothetical protein
MTGFSRQDVIKDLADFELLEAEACEVDSDIESGVRFGCGAVG